MKPTLNNLVQQLIGKTAQANHPLSHVNPDSHFIVKDAKIEHGIVFLRGDDTVWFGDNLLVVFDD